MIKQDSVNFNLHATPSPPINGKTFRVVSFFKQSPLHDGVIYCS